MTNKRVRVLVLGGRLTPSLIATLSDPPDAIEFIVSDDRAGCHEQALGVLARPLEDQLDAFPPRVQTAPPFDWEECQACCQNAVERHTDTASITFDVSGAPKFMSFAVQAFAAQNGHEAVVVDTAGAREVSLVTRQSRPVTLPTSVEDYLGLFGWQSQPAFDPNTLTSLDNAHRIAQELGKGGRAATTALNKFNSWTPGQRGREIKPQGDDALVDDGEFEIFNLLLRYGFITALSRAANGKIIYRTSINAADVHFISGPWLEMYVWDEAQKLRDEATGKPLFSDCQLSFKIPSRPGGRDMREVDVGCLYQGQFIHCSCKARSPKESFNKRNLDEMRGVSDLLGGDFATRILVTNAFQLCDENQWKFVKQAEELKIVLVTGDELARVGEILCAQATEPKYARI